MNFTKTTNVKILATVFGFLMAPAFITAQSTVGNTLVGTVCLVRVYHTNFNFPPQGGQIVTIGDEMFFWRNYLPECAGMVPGTAATGYQPVVSQTQTYNPSLASDQYSNVNLSGSLPTQFVGSPCAVRVYHTNFKFPPEGGKIVQVGAEMYFIRDYKPGCESAGAGAPVLVASTSAYNPVQTAGRSTIATPAYVNPSYSPTAAIQTNYNYSLAYRNNPAVVQNTAQQATSCY